MLGTLAVSHRDSLSSSLIKKINGLWFGLELNDMGLVVRNRKKMTPLVPTGLRTGHRDPGEPSWQRQVREEGLVHLSQFQTIYKHCITDGILLVQIFWAGFWSWRLSRRLSVNLWWLLCLSSVNRTDLLGGNFAGVTHWDWAFPTVLLKAIVDVDTRIFQKIHGSTEDRYKLFSPGVVRQLKAKVQGGVSAAG